MGLISPLQKLRNLSLRLKLALSVLVLIVVLAIFGLYIFRQLNVIDASFSRLDGRYDQLKDLQQVSTDTSRLSNSVKFYVLTRDEKWQSQYNETSLDLKDTLTDIKQNILTDSERGPIAQYEKITASIQGTELLILAEAQEGHTVQARNLFDLTYEAEQAQAADVITNLVGKEGQNVATMISNNRLRLNATKQKLGITLVLLTVLILALVLALAADIISSVRALTVAAVRFAKGDFDARVQVGSQDEIGRLGEEFNAMAVEIKQSYEQLSHEKARFVSSINSLPLGFIVTGFRNEIITINPAMQRMLGFKTISSDIDSVTKQFAQSRILSALLERAAQCLHEQKIAVMPELIDEGNTYRALLSPVLVAGGAQATAIGTVIVVENITEEKILNRSRDEFFSIASHELRTPLTAIRGNSSMIQQYFPDALRDPALRGIVDDIKDSSVRLIDIVNDFLDVSRLEQGKIAFTPEVFSIEEVIESVTYEIAAVAREKHNHIDIEKTLSALPQIIADKNRVKQIIYNLVGNAMKFTENGTISIKATPAGQKIKVLVSDTGPGISEEGQKLLFHKFQQATKSIYTRDSTRGTGLGLYISKLLVEKMGGEITLENSKLGVGTTFSFTLPLATAENTASVHMQPKVQQ